MLIFLSYLLHGTPTSPGMGCNFYTDTIGRAGEQDPAMERTSYFLGLKAFFRNKSQKFCKLEKG